MTIASGMNSQAIMVSFGTEQVPVRAWRGEQLQGLLALDCETVAFEENDPAPCPELVLLSVFDGEVAYLIRREAVGRFLSAHRASEVEREHAY